MILLTTISYDFVFAEPSLRVTDCIQSKHQIRYNIYADGFIPNTRIIVSFLMPDAERPNSAGGFTDSSGSWKAEGAGYWSTDGIANGTTRFEAYNVEEDRERLSNSPYATAELITPCPYVSTPPDTEVYASVNDKEILNGDSVSSDSISFIYYIRDNFAAYAQFECKLDNDSYEDCTIDRCEIPGTCPQNSSEYGQKEYDNLPPGEHHFMVRATDDAGNTDPTPAEFWWTILRPVADAGSHQTVSGNEIVMLDGTNSYDPDNSSLIYEWRQTNGPEVVLADTNSANPTFIAPETTEQIDLTFQLIVTNAEETTSEPDEVIITVNPVSTPPTEPRTIQDIIRGIIQNPLDITNSIESSNEIIDILTDDNRDNDQAACNLLDQFSNEEIVNIRDVLNC